MSWEVNQLEKINRKVDTELQELDAEFEELVQEAQKIKDEGLSQSFIDDTSALKLMNEKNIHLSKIKESMIEELIELEPEYNAL